jgi:hypothetical protein
MNGERMDTLEKLRKINPNRVIYSLNDSIFESFGRLLNISLPKEIIQFMEEEADFPETANCYVASEALMEASDFKEEIAALVFGQMDIQIGYCNGNGNKINGFEFHQCSEVFISITDSLLALTLPHKPLGSKAYQIEESYLFFVPKGSILEIYPMIGHFAPIKVRDQGFRSVIILSKGSNGAIKKMSESENSLYTMNMDENKNRPFAKNKWLYVHEDRMDLVDKGAYLNVYGDNSPIKVL